MSGVKFLIISMVFAVWSGTANGSGSVPVPRIDPGNSHRMILERSDGSSEPYLHIGRSAYLLLDPRVNWEEFLEDAHRSGADTLRILLMVDWRRSGRWQVNPWASDPGSVSPPGETRSWWQRFDDAPGGYWSRLGNLLARMGQLGMVAELCLFDHATIARLNAEHPGEGRGFLKRISGPGGNPRLTAFLDRLAGCLSNHPNVIVEMGNQIAAAWFRSGYIPGTRIQLQVAAAGDSDLDCALWMYETARYLQNRFPPGRAPLMTSSARYHDDRFFELTLKDSWNNPVSYHSSRLAEDWPAWNWVALNGPPGCNSGLRKRYSFPFIDNEPMTFGDRIHPGYSHTSRDLIRRHAWITMVAGGYSTYHSHWGIECVPDRYLSSTQRSGAAYLRHFSGFWKSLGNAFNHLEPRPSLCLLQDSCHRIFCSATPDNDVVIAYLAVSASPAGVSATLQGQEITMMLDSSRYDVEWLDPDSGIRHPAICHAGQIVSAITLPAGDSPADDRVLIMVRK